MSFADDFLRQQQGAKNATQAAGPPSPWGEDIIGGFIGSTLSAVPELFGAKPTPEAEAFRGAHPYLGIASELTGGIAPYAITGALSTGVRGATILGEAMEAIPGIKTLTAVDNPILHAAAKEVIRYSPVEIARLGVGLGTTDDWHHYGNLLADVGFSTLITGGFGGFGGFFRVGSKTLPHMGEVAGAPVGLRPTFLLRMSRTEGATPTNPKTSMADLQNDLMREVFQEKPDVSKIPGQKAAYVNGLEGGEPATDALMNTLFRPAPGEKSSLRRRPLMKQDGTWALDEGAMKEFLAGVETKSSGAIKTIEDVADNMVFPRLVDVSTNRSLGVVNKALDESAMQWIGDGVMGGKETNGGLHVMAVRLKAPTAAETASDAASRAGMPKIGQGDQWLLFKTDKPHLFAPEGYKLAKLNVEQWARFKEPWRPTGMNDFANASMDATMEHFTPADYKDVATQPKSTAISNITQRLVKRFAETADLQDSAMIRSMASSFYDIMAPTVVNERRSPLFARLFGALRQANRAGDAIVNRMMGGKVKITGNLWTRGHFEHTEGLAGYEPIVQAIGRLNKDELQDFYRIGTAQAPKEELEKYTADGMISDNLRKAVEVVQALDRHVWENHLMPAFKNANLEGKFDLLEGYIMPRLFTGDWFAPVIDEGGKLHWLGNGSKTQAVAQAQKIVDEAALVGRKLKINEPYLMGMGKPVDEIGSLHDLVQMQIGKDAQMQEIVQRAMKKMAMDKAAVKGRTTLPKIGPPKSVTESRIGVAGSPDIAEPTAQDILKSIDNHYKQLFRFAATSAWRQRFLPLAADLKKQDATLFEDLLRKQNQIMGYEGQFTNALNRALTPILGQALGGKAATKIATATNGLIYAWNLSIANPTFALLNVLQPIQTVLPHLAFILNAPSEAVERDMRMVLRYGADGKPRAVHGVLEPARILGRAMQMMGKPPADLAEALGHLKTDGTLNAQLFEGWIGGQSRGLETLSDAFKNNGGGVAGSWEVMKRGSTMFAERSEEVSRAIAAISYHILGKEYLGLEGDKLLQFMRNGTRNSMFGYSLLDRSRMFTGPVGSMFGLFKNWQMHFIASMFQYAGLGWNKGTWAPLVWQFGAAGAMGGLGAMGPLKWVADSLASWNDNSPNSYLWMQDHWHDSADEIYFGLPALFGASLQASSTMPGTDVRNDLTSLSSFVFAERAKAAWQAVGAAWDYGAANGQDPLKNPNVRDQLMQAFAPRAFFRAFASVEGDYIKSMSTGYPQVRGVSPLSKFLYGAGFNQVEVERQQVAARELWKDDAARRLTEQQMGIALADAKLNGDWDEMERINQRAIAMGVPTTSVYKSAMTRLRREQNQDLLSRYRGQDAQKYREAWQGE